MKKAGAGSTPRKPNAVRRIMQAEERKRSSDAAAAARASPAPTVSSTRAQCPNKACPGSDVRDGVCHGCGVVVDDSNIVAEVQFGESSNGAAIVQGSYFGADQGGVRAAPGTAFRRVAGSGTSESRERTFREIKQLISQFARQLRISDALAESGFRNYKMASIDYNFVQGRQRNTVAAMCLYAACRREETCKVMLIDLADLVKYDVFQLGQDYKAFLALYPEIRLGTKPIIMEDLIFRFAARLEFGRDTNKVALAAVRIAQRMRYDEMTHGRKPAGICGAAIIMAARAHNYRRTVREVVYIAKVTMHTLLARMEEFSNVPSAQMSFEEFTNNDFLEAHHDPPIAYKRSKEWLEKHPQKPKRKLMNDFGPDGREIDGQDATEDVTDAGDGQGREKRQRTAPPESQSQPDIPIDPQLAALTMNQSSQAGSSSANPIMMRSPSATPEPGSSTAATIIDKDGFVVPPRPARPTGALNQEDRANIAMATTEGDDELGILADQFNDADADDDDNGSIVDPSSERAMAMAQGIAVPSRKGKTVGSRKGKEKETQPTLSIPINEEWEADEAALEDEMEAHLNDPEMASKTSEVIREQKKAANKADKKLKKANQNAAAAAADREASATPALEGQDECAASEPPPTPHPFAAPVSKVSSDEIIGEDEFKDDPEVIHCKLSETEIRIKERIWANHNREFMRDQQQKIFAAKMEQKNPKKTRNRSKKPRLGEGQTSPASTPGEAATNALQKRNVSMRINYDFDSEMFMSKLRGPGSMYGGGTSVGSRSAVTSRAASVDGGSQAGDENEPLRRPGGALRSPSPEAAEEEEPTVAGMDVDVDESYTQGGGEEEYEEFEEEELDPFS